MIEWLVRYVDLAPDQRERLLIGTPVEDGQVVEPIRIDAPEWLAISHVIDPEIGERHLLYYLFDDGKIIDFAQRASLEEAIGEVGSVVSPDSWRVCSVELHDPGDRIPRASIR